MQPCRTPDYFSRYSLGPGRVAPNTGCNMASSKGPRERFRRLRSPPTLVLLSAIGPFLSLMTIPDLTRDPASNVLKPDAYVTAPSHQALYDMPVKFRGRLER